ncbi:pyridoxal-phosphate dependent enzyme [Actinophytocola xanthii]|uniref:Cysteine synthase n=1 Tax=Actinophytocola xanthii TaxID=1912961 RepID=A0A1Q8CYY8_9PSEU|nr:pyridoxal-phosphate dependent enzyme [Actinophytocola xanthii]OLF19569.1 cysteine synthase [Actinophytocola xanthii]
MSTAHPHVWAAEALQVLRAEQRVTPLRRLSAPGCDGIEVLLKDESALPTGSLKYRLVLALFSYAIASGRITEGTHVVVGTGGAVAVAGARVARLLGLPFTAVVPAKVGAEVLDRIGREGGRWQVGEQPPAAVQQEAAALAAGWGGHFLDHFSSAEQAVAAEGATIADELFEQVDTVPDWIVVGVGTGATSAAFGRALRRRGLTTRLAAVDPENSAYFPAWVTGAEDYGTGMPSLIPGIGRPRVEPGFQPALLDLVIPVPDAASIAAAWWLREVGVDAGPATGANLWGVRHLARRMREEGARGTIVSVVGDSGEGYRTTHLAPDWVRARGLDPRPYVAEFRGEV